MSINAESLLAVEIEMKRFIAAVQRLKKEQPEAFSQKDAFISSGKHTGEVRRSSMDLSRALFSLRSAGTEQ